MCHLDNDKRIAANKYLSDAKKRTKHLKKLKSVSRAYRKAEVRGLKAKAHQLEVEAKYEKEVQDRNRRQYEMLAAASDSGGQYGTWRGVNAGAGFFGRFF